MDVIAELTEEYDRYVENEHVICRDCPAMRSGVFVVYSMLEWKAVYGDGRLDHWTVRDIHAYLLDHFPRKVSADRRLLADTPACVRDFVYFMSDRGTLTGEDGGVLGDAADEVFEEFVAANKDKRNWGLAKRTLLGGMFSSGGEVDEGYPTRVTMLPAGVEPSRVAASGSGRSTAAARRKRKAVRVARRGNRR